MEPLGAAQAQKCLLVDKPLYSQPPFFPALSLLSLPPTAEEPSLSHLVPFYLFIVAFSHTVLLLNHTAGTLAEEQSSPVPVLFSQ